MSGPPLRQPLAGERGHSGVKRSAGRILGETNPSLRGWRWAETVYNALRQCPEAAQDWSVRKQICLSARFRWVSPKGGTLASARMADHLNEAFGFDGRRGRMCESWEAVMGRLWDFIPYGYRYAEVVWKEQAGKVWIDRLADRPPQAHDRWLVAEDGRSLAGALQRSVSGQPAPEPIPAEKMFHLVRSQIGDNWEGEGLIRPAERWIRLAAHLFDALAVGADRWAIPMPRVKADYQAALDQGYGEGQLQAELDDKRTEAAALVGHEESYVVDTPAVSWDVYGGDLDPSAIISALDECDAQIAKAFGTQFLRLGVSDTGARHVGEVHRDILIGACVNDLDYVAGEVERQLAAPLLWWNFGLEPGDPRAPRLEHTGVEVNRLGDLLPHIPALTAAGHITPHAVLEEALLRLGGVEIPPEALARPAEERLEATHPDNGRPPDDEPRPAKLPNPGDSAPGAPPLRGAE